MTTKRNLDNAKLGAFVLAGLLFSVFALYMIGKNRSLFGSTFTLMADFHNINGLTSGNNVRFSGIDVGTVKAVTIVRDGTVRVTMVIDNDVKKFIHQNAVASVGTDGLMGNKLISIKSQPGLDAEVRDGDLIQTMMPVETDAMLHTLNRTNDNISVITGNLKEITQKLNASNSLWSILADTTIARDLKQAVTSIRKAGNNTEAFTHDASDMVKRLKNGKGPANAMFTDSLLSKKIRGSISEIQQASSSLKETSIQLAETMKKIKHGDGLTGVLLTDTTASRQLKKTIFNIEQGTGRFNENMEAMKHNFLFRGYFKDQEKEKDKAKKK